MTQSTMNRLMITAVGALMSLAVTAQETIKLPAPDRSATNMSVMTALAQRQSIRSFSTRELSDEQLSLLLWAANGVNRKDGRLTAPPAMNRQDIQLYVCRKDGAYSYDAASHSLPLVSREDLRPAAAGDRQPFVMDAPICLVVVSDQRKFGQRPARDFSCIDAGYVSQNIYLTATAMGLGTVARAMMDRERVIKGLGLVEEQLLLLNHPVGYVKE